MPILGSGLSAERDGVARLGGGALRAAKPLRLLSVDIDLIFLMLGKEARRDEPVARGFAFGEEGSGDVGVRPRVDCVMSFRSDRVSCFVADLNGVERRFRVGDRDVKRGRFDVVFLFNTESDSFGMPFNGFLGVFWLEKLSLRSGFKGPSLGSKESSLYEREPRTTLAIIPSTMTKASSAKRSKHRNEIVYRS